MENENEGTTGTEQEQGGTGAGEESLGDPGKRALDAERKARAAAEKRLKDAEAKLKAADDAGKSDLERLQGQVAELTKQAEAAQAKADRYEIAADKGLTIAQARRLVGSTKDELEADAEAMRQELGLDKKGDDQDKDPASKARPTEDLKLGASNSDDEQPDAAKLADSVLKSAW